MFMTPLIFHAIDFSAREVGSGLAVSALIGTVVRLLSGGLLDRGIRCSWPVRVTTLLAIAADLILLQADNYNSYLLGQHDNRVCQVIDRFIHLSSVSSEVWNCL